MLPTPALVPLSFAYGALVRARLALYGVGALKSRDAGAPVVSVGNITAGGTGKTPLVEWAAGALADEGRRVCVLTRGYGRREEWRRVVASDGGRLMADVDESGDEPRLLAERLLGKAAVVCDADRVEAGRWAVKELGSEVFVLDDGFQHLRIARDLDIVTVDATDPWGGGRLLPFGRLREPLSGLARAGCVVITRADMAEDLARVSAEAERLTGGRAPVFASTLRTTAVRPLADAVDGGEAVGPFAAFCGVGNPRAFFAHLRNEGRELVYTRAFQDHHAYTQRDVDALTSEAGRRGARSLLTTAKDAVKLRRLSLTSPCYVVEVGLEFDDREGLLALLRRAADAERRD
ncbi:MAG TPA: tetraacyldisaccharide 4'-kinase [Pyrinomonadaceae bacterium]|jgi:tetraacyldisaccharide 4'-kinase|nr:tetraacyldisaccharide 4'-kinase [Pyrinomonadaceae bacterium]